MDNTDRVVSLVPRSDVPEKQDLLNLIDRLRNAVENDEVRELFAIIVLKCGCVSLDSTKYSDGFRVLGMLRVLEHRLCVKMGNRRRRRR